MSKEIKLRLKCFNYQRIMYEHSNDQDRVTEMYNLLLLKVKIFNLLEINIDFPVKLFKMQKVRKNVKLK